MFREVEASARRIAAVTNADRVGLKPEPTGRLDEAPSLEPMLRMLVEAIGYPLMVLDSLQRPIHANAPGWSVFDGDGVLQLRDGRVVASDAMQQASWALAVSDCMAGGQRLLMLGDESAAVPVAISALGNAYPMTIGSVLVVLGRSMPYLMPAVLAFSERYGLTPAEIRVTSALLRGESPDDVAALNQLSVHTVRTQIRSVLEKTGCTSQRALLLRLSALPPMIANPVTKSSARV